MAPSGENPFRARPLVLLGAGVIAVAIVSALIPSTFYPEWRATVRAMLTAVAVAPWAFATIARGRTAAYLAFAAVMIGVSALVDLVF